ncbi:unnamed protein product [Heligmosomoides polygyrus]|uniref:dUTPase domain-containing protein n=1 Tax=Heligmosomoides polygyrus TaxID=6339 RepID=A0A183FSE1_HELPZ|nr:unnamed protein product [Heligmosomoides polygyrus]
MGDYHYVASRGDDALNAPLLESNQHQGARSLWQCLLIENAAKHSPEGQRSTGWLWPATASSRTPGFPSLTSFTTFTSSGDLDLPFGYYGRVALRSFLAAKNFTNVGAGVLDSEHRRGLNVLFLNFGLADREVKERRPNSEFGSLAICLRAESTSHKSTRGRAHVGWKQQRGPKVVAQWIEEQRGDMDQSSMIELFGPKQTLIRRRFEFLQSTCEPLTTSHVPYRDFSNKIKKKFEDASMKGVDDDSLKCLVFLSGLADPSHSDVRLRLLNRLNCLKEDDASPSLDDFVNDCETFVALRSDNRTMESKEVNAAHYIKPSEMHRRRPSRNVMFRH